MRVTLKEYMDKKGLGQSDMAKLFGLKQPTIFTYLNSGREVYVVKGLEGLQLVERKVLATKV